MKTVPVMVQRRSFYVLLTLQVTYPLRIASVTLIPVNSTGFQTFLTTPLASVAKQIETASS